MIRIQITEEMIQKAKGIILQRGLRLKPKYEGKTTEELLSIFELQVIQHLFFCVSSKDDVIMAVSRGILLERGYQDKVERIWQENMEKLGEYEESLLKQTEEAQEEN